MARQTPSSSERPLVLLHGIGTGPGAWRPQLDVLSRQRDVLAPDLVPDFARGWSAVVDAVSTLVAARGPVDVCGLSIGAQAALQVAATRPDDVHRLVVCAGFARLPPRLRRRVRAMAWLIGFLPAGVVHRQLAGGVPSTHRSDALAGIAQLRSRQLSRLMREAAGVEIDVERIVAPTLVLCGEQDRENLRLAETLASALPHATLMVVPHAGHVANLDAPDAFTSLLDAFLCADQVWSAAPAVDAGGTSSSM